MARALFFGRLRDVAGCSEREVGLERAVGLDAFRLLAAGSDHALAEALGAPSIRVAVNAVLGPARSAQWISPGDEVAFMPPFSGG